MSTLKDGRENLRGCRKVVRFADGWRLVTVVTHIRQGRWIVERQNGVRTTVREEDMEDRLSEIRPARTPIERMIDQACGLEPKR